MTDAAVARLISLIDLTSLDEADTPEVVDALCDKAVTVAGPVAAVCVLPAFVAQCAERLDGTGVRIATVANFPAGEDDADAAARETAAAIDEGADEVDVVVPWRAWLAGDEDAVTRLVTACAAEAPGRLKTILETGSHPTPSTTLGMARAATAAGASFLKTSTGKVGPGASPEAAQLLLHVAGPDVGVKVSGGIRTRADAASYVALADELRGAPVSSMDFRIGASSLLDDLLRA